MINKAGRILSVSPATALPGGEVFIECEDFTVDYSAGYGCFFDGQRAKLVGASSSRVIAVVPEGFDTFEVEIYLESGADRSESHTITVGKRVVQDLHLVANPAVDPKDDSIIVTRSGSRGQSLPITMFRLEPDGYLQEMSTDVMNPTGVAFDQNGELFVTNRFAGEVCRIDRDEEAVTFAENLGIATGIAFDKENTMYVGDRHGTIFRVSDFGIPEVFANLEPSVSAYHLAFDPDGNLCVTAPGLSSFDAIYQIDKSGSVSVRCRGFGRPQGIAFSADGSLFIAACYEARRGIFRVAEDCRCELIVAGPNLVGLCFNKLGDMIIASTDAIYKVPGSASAIPG